jgi:hypothetical protein
VRISIQFTFALLIGLVGLVHGRVRGGGLEDSAVAMASKSRTASVEVAMLVDKNNRQDANGQQSPVVEKKVRPASPAENSPGLELAKTHFSELLPVLKHLRVHSPSQYEKAIRDLDRSAKRLESIKRRDSQLFDISLREWKTRGHIDLLKAKVRVKKSDFVQQEILQQLKILHGIELERLQRELVIIDERLVVHDDRVRQTKQLIDRGVVLRKKLTDERLRLESETIDENSQVYLRAIGHNKSDSSRAGSALPFKSTSDKVSNAKE